MSSPNPIVQNRSWPIRRVSMMLAVGACFVLLYEASIKRQGPIENPINEKYGAEHLAAVHARFVGQGIDLYDTKHEKVDEEDSRHAKGEWFDLPVDVWSKIETVAQEANFASTLSRDKLAFDDLLEIGLETYQGKTLHIRLKVVVDNCCCFVFHCGPSLFVYKNLNKKITSDVLTNVASRIIGRFQDGDLPFAREQVEQDLLMFSRIANDIEASKKR